MSVNTEQSLNQFAKELSALCNKYKVSFSISNDGLFVQDAQIDHSFIIAIPTSATEPTLPKLIIVAGDVYEENT